MNKITKLSKPQEKALINLEKGDIIMFHGKRMAFLNFKRGGNSFEALGTSDNRRYTCKGALYSTKFTVESVMEFEEPKTEIKKLKRGMLFVIQQRKDALLLRFDEFTRTGRIKAHNPFDKSLTFTIDPSFTVTLIKSLPE